MDVYDDRAGEATPCALRGRRRLHLREWLVVLAVSVVAALFLRAFCFQAFRIPTPSMEKSLLAGDFVIVSKLHYGPRLPRSLGIPLTNWYLDGVTLPDVRLPGFSTLHRGDVVVFNYPPENGPIDRKTHYIKRLVGLPGDTLAIVRKQVYVNGAPLPSYPGLQQRWVASSRSATFPIDELRARGGEVLSIRRAPRRGARIAFEATEEVAREVAAWEAVASVEPLLATTRDGMQPRTYPPGAGFTPDFYGPVYIPSRGDTLRLTDRTWSLYGPIIYRYEGHEARRLPDGRFEVDGAITDRYVVEQDYFFVLGDNRDNSQDSRYWGFVPMDHLVGKAVLIYFSWDLEQHRPRFDRLFRAVR